MSVAIDGDEYVGVVVDMFSGTESFSQAFDDSDDWFVLTIEKNDVDGVDFDPDLETDIRELSPWDIRRKILERTEQDVAVEERFQTDPERNTDPVHGKVVDEQPDDPKFAFVILASPPCTTFSRAFMGKYWQQTGPDEYAPKTPKSRRRVALTQYTLYLIHTLQPDYWFLENPVGMMKHVIAEEPDLITWCQYGDDTQKPTYLFGEKPESFDVRKCQRNADCHVANPRGDYNFRDSRETPVERAAIPEGLSEHIRDAVVADWPPYPRDREDGDPESNGQSDVSVQVELGAGAW